MSLVLLGLMRMQSFVLVEHGWEGLVGWELLPQVVQLSHNLGWQLWGFHVAVLCATVFPLSTTVCEPHSVLVSRRRHFNVDQIKSDPHYVRRIIFSDSSHCHGPKRNPNCKEIVTSLNWTHASILNQQRPTKSISPNQFCNLFDCRWLRKRVPVWV